MKTATVIRHLAFEDLGSLADALKQQNYIFNYVEAGLDSISNLDPLSLNLLIILGWSPFKLSAAGIDSSLAYLVAEDANVLHWHGDTFELPPGATHLASSQQYQNQAFAWGKSALALQFHPEVTAPGLERWFIGHAGEISITPGIGVRTLRASMLNTEWVATVATRLRSIILERMRSTLVEHSTACLARVLRKITD